MKHIEDSEELGFDRSKLEHVLHELRPGLAAAFGISCAQRLYCFLVEYFGSDEGLADDAKFYETCLQFAWSAAGTGEWNLQQLESLAPSCERKVPDSERSWNACCPYAQDAALAVCYSIRALKVGRSGEAAWSAEIAYSVADDIACRMSASGLDVRQRSLQNPVQIELHQQKRGLAEMQRASISQPERHIIIAAERQRAVEEGDQLFAISRSLNNFRHSPT